MRREETKRKLSGWCIMHLSAYEEGYMDECDAGSQVYCMFAVNWNFSLRQELFMGTIEQGTNYLKM